MNRRVRPQDLQEHPAIDGRSPLIRLIDDIEQRTQTGPVPSSEWHPGKWQARHKLFLITQNERLRRQRRILQRYGILIRP